MVLDYETMSQYGWDACKLTLAMSPLIALGVVFMNAYENDDAETLKRGKSTCAPLASPSRVRAARFSHSAAHPRPSVVPAESDFTVPTLE